MVAQATKLSPSVVVCWTTLLPGDLVLADRGFTITDAVGLHCSKLVIPAFTKGKQQLSAHEDEKKTRNLANVRIHIERVI